MTAADTEVGARFDVHGVVQGVGFRPFVHRLATELGLAGHVGNDAAKVFIAVTGPGSAVDEFADRLGREAPPLAVIDRIDRTSVAPSDEDGFQIVASRAAAGRTLVPPDVAACDDCVHELLDRTDRRHRHPFITCTNCGPRFTIIRDLPYDRRQTTMAGFEMCAPCRTEYDDPTDRRHHAQPIACNDCGPTLTFRGGSVEAVGHGAIDATSAAILAGDTIAMKGIGGFHLVCDATDDDAVRRLRARKHRPDKPLAVLVASVDHAAELAVLDEAEIAQLTSAARPIVLVRARPDSTVSALVAPGNPMLGLMLPYTPVHHLLFAEQRQPLVMTSANRSGQPIVHRDEDADQLVDLCDGFLTHDRPIQTPCDDSVVRVIGDRLLPIRRARGYAPLPVALSAQPRVLAVGGDLKNTFCLVGNGHAWVSQHVGDMANVETLRAFESAVESYQRMYGVTPDVIASDAHPGYQSSRWADRAPAPHHLLVQHHHAHVAAVMAEHHLDPAAPVIGIAFDGTGYGDDGAIWGGEILVADASAAERWGHLGEVLLPGGDAAIEHPCRLALSHLHAAGIDWRDGLAPVDACDDELRRALGSQLDSGFGCVATTSMGRLFDAVSSLLGLRHHVSFEAQAAIDLEILAERGSSGSHHPFPLVDGIFDPGPVIRAIVRDLDAGVLDADIARSFHGSVAGIVTDAALAIRATRGIDVVALSGGVFQNAFLVGLCVEQLEADGFQVHTHRLVPPNDGGLSLGQAFVAAHTAAMLSG